MAAENERPPHVSSFKVTIDGTNGEIYEHVSPIGLDLEDISFQSDKNQMLNRPGRWNARDLHMTRIFRDNDLYKWMKETKDGKKTPKSGSIVWLDDEQKELRRFNFFGAWPKSWSTGTMSKGGANDVATEEIVLSISDVELA